MSLMPLRAGQAARPPRVNRRTLASSRRRVDITPIVRPQGRIFLAFPDRVLTDRAEVRDVTASETRTADVQPSAVVIALGGSEPHQPARNRVSTPIQS